MTLDHRDGPILLQRHDSALGRWLLARWRPAHLAGAVDQLWYFEGTVLHPRERVFPGGYIEFNVQLGPCYGEVRGDRVERFAPTCITGLLLRPNVIEAPRGPSIVLGVRLLPTGAYAVLGAPVHELTGVTVDLADVVGQAAAELVERCAAAERRDPGRHDDDATIAARRLRVAADWVAERVARGRLADPAIAWAAGEIARAGGAVSVTALRERAGWSKSRFATLFREQVGVAPKRLARLVRFRRALELVSRGDLPLSGVALAAGYYDQPHFNAEFRELAGLAPGELRAARRYPESVNLAEPAR